MDADNSGAMTAARHKGGGKWRILLFLAVIVALLVAARFLPLKEYLDAVLQWVEGLGVWGPMIVVLIYIAACVFFLPGSVLTLGIGFLFGVVQGSIITSVASTLGACVAFWVGRTVARDWVGHRVAGNAKFAAIDEAVGRQGFKMVLLTRLSPVFPFNLLNYAFGLTRVRFRDYALASWIGMLPGTIMYVYLGHAGRQAALALADATAGPAEQTLAQKIFFWAGLVVAVVVAVFVTRIARRALREAAPQIQRPEGEHTDG